MSEREEWMNLIRNEYDPMPDLGRGAYKTFEDSWDDGAGRIADAILADKLLLLRKHADEKERLEKAEWVLRSSGFRRCDIPACNCNSWHQIGGYAERFREIQEAVEEAGYSTNGKILLDVIKEILVSPSQRDIA